MYAGISRDITYNTSLNVNLVNTADYIYVAEDNNTIEGENLDANVDVTYKVTKVKRAQIEEVLGENGIVTVINSENGQEIVSISNKTETDENGYINIVYPNNIRQIEIRTSKPEKVGKIEFETTKTINGINNNYVKTGINLKSNVSGKYLSNSKENQIQQITSYIELQETETTASLDISKTYF